MSKEAFKLIAYMAVVASIIMYSLGNNSRNLTELKDVWWLPLPVAAIFFLIGITRKTKS
jgi:hypothetical protein